MRREIHHRFLPHLKCLTLAVAAVLLAACGGGGESGDDDGEGQASSFATSTNLVGNASAGQALYISNCASCHGASYGKAKNYAETLSAIARNKGGMGFLAATIQTTQANDIATYLAFGASGSGPTLPIQSIGFASPGDLTLATPSVNLTASSTSGLSVSITSTTPNVCSVNGAALTLLSVGTCTLTASQAGNTSFAAATPVTVSFVVNAASGPSLSAQNISFTSPGNQTLVSATPAPMSAPLSANATSGLPVSFASTTVSVCTVSGITLTMRQPGTCIIAANQAGDASWAPAPTVSVTFYVVANNALAGKTAYNQVINGSSCASCHGTPPGGQALLAANADVVLANSIARGMGGIQVGDYTQQQILDISAYLATPNL